MSTLLKQEQPTFGTLAGNGRTFEVPPFQRDYSWDKEEWEDLWLDLIGIDEEGDHYMGYVVLQETKESKRFLIIDGQQRISTICILILSAVKLLKDKGDIERSELLRNTYLSYKEPTSLIYKTKLKLNRNNNYVYDQLLQLQIPQYTAGLKPSEKKLIGAFKYFNSELEKYFKLEPTEAIAAFVSKKVDEKLFFTSITVGDDIDAYKVFETLNARGVKLSTADLLKNYLFSKVFSRSEGEVENLEKRWYRINDLLGKTDITNYIRHFWNSRNYPTERKATLFKTIKKKVNTYELSIELINALDESVFIYAALINPDSEVWVGDQTRYISEINTLDVSQCFPLLMVAKIKFTEQEFTKLLRDVVSLSFRYNTIGGLNPNELERIYGRASVAIFKAELTTAKEVFQKHLKDVYIEDNSFKNDFKNKVINTNKYNALVKYILAKLEVQYGGAEVSLTNKNLTIEHILPENPNDEWVNQFPNVDVQDYIFRIGNFTLLESSKNKEADRKSFDEKQKIYSTSNYQLSKEQTQHSIWNVASLSTRQMDMANKAATVWKINYA
jgi:uncharacterized protein with ParB-like and HNH nuclease domain